ncbi:MAG: helix-turn-helix transcriptional regulator [Catenulispora sp.]|nr:helix-turn-helix transcriptional regulator [Catenulispora sp.]
MQEPVTTIEVDGQAIWAARMQAGIEVKALADAAGVSYSYVRKLERGIRRRMSHETYQRLRAALQADPKQLLAQTGQAEEGK